MTQMTKATPQMIADAKEHFVALRAAGYPRSTAERHAKEFAIEQHWAREDNAIEDEMDRLTHAPLAEVLRFLSA